MANHLFIVVAVTLRYLTSMIDSFFFIQWIEKKPTIFNTLYETYLMQEKTLRLTNPTAIPQFFPLTSRRLFNVFCPKFQCTMWQLFIFLHNSVCYPALVCTFTFTGTQKKVTENPRNEWEFAMMLYEITFFVFLYEEHLYNRPLHSSCSSPVPCAGQTNGCPLVGLS